MKIVIDVPKLIYDTAKECGYIKTQYDEIVAQCFSDITLLEKVFEDIKAEFISKYPKNFANEPELGGCSCVFSLNEVLEIIDKHIADMRGAE